jgi:hypothetical protein
MAHAVPSQVCNLIARLFPDLGKEVAQPGAHGLRPGTAVRAVLDLIDKIPDELVRLSADDFAFYYANVSALQSAWDDRNRSANQVTVGPLPNEGHTTLFEIYRMLGKCPDEAAVAATTGLEFIPNDEFREALRSDISSANSALMNREYKAATVLAGSVVEALLFWALEKEGETEVRTRLDKAAPPKPLNEWTLGPIVAAASACKLITDSTTTQAELAQNFRNLIHPGRQARLKETCDRGSALGALAAVERVATDLAKKYPSSVPQSAVP